MFFEIYKNPDAGKYWWEAKREDETTLCTSGPMPSKEDCLAAILIVKHGVAGANVYDQTGDQSGPVEARRIDI
jgi:uncharacterized protein YegP (UPF0339 family)